MPNLNGTGPRGRGRMTGRGLGNCEDSLKEPQFTGRNRQFRKNRFVLDEIESLRKAVEEIKAKLDNNN